MKLADLMEGLPVIEWKGDRNTEVSDICYHSERAAAGSAFVAIEGLKSDGHKYLADAFSRGAVAAAVSKEFCQLAALRSLPQGRTAVRVKDTRAALSRMAANFYGKPSEGLTMIGVTGTNGKTSITWMIHAILQQQYGSVGQIGSLGIYFSHRWKPSTHTTPESLELQKLLRGMLNSGLKSCVMEVSSHALELNRVRDIDFDGAVFANLTHEHLDFHKSMEQYYMAKRKLFYMTGQFNVINTDDIYGKRLALELSSGRGTRLITYGLGGEAHFKAHDIRIHKNYTEFLLVTPTGEVPVKTCLPGKYNIYNCLAAAACAEAMGLELTQIRDGLEGVRQIPGRFEQIPAEGNVNIIIDYAHTPDGFRQILETVRQTAKGRIVMVFGCVGERDKSKRSVMGQIASKYSDLCILTTDNCRSEDPEDIINQIKKGFIPGTKHVEILDRETAIRYAILSSKENDTILITGKGHEQRQIIGDTVYYFNEREIISVALRERSRQAVLGAKVAQMPV
jgi:UDP-N-acetylmuramoyl-L-alanyl-D-glutamate--2,6-diaminopimelate ligase